MAWDFKTSSLLEPLLRRGQQGRLGRHTVYNGRQPHWRNITLQITLHYSILWVGHRNFTAWIQYFKFETESKFPFSATSHQA